MTARVAIVIDVSGGHVGLETAKNEADALALAFSRQATPLQATVAQVFVQDDEGDVSEFNAYAKVDETPTPAVDEPAPEVPVTPAQPDQVATSPEGVTVESADIGVVPGSVVPEPVEPAPPAAPPEAATVVAPPVPPVEPVVEPPVGEPDAPAPNVGP